MYHSYGSYPTRLVYYEMIFIDFVRDWSGELQIQHFALPLVNARDHGGSRSPLPRSCPKLQGYHHVYTAQDFTPGTQPASLPRPNHPTFYQRGQLDHRWSISWPRGMSSWETAMNGNRLGYLRIFHIWDTPLMGDRSGNWLKHVKTPEGVLQNVTRISRTKHVQIYRWQSDPAANECVKLSQRDDKTRRRDND